MLLHCTILPFLFFLLGRRCWWPPHGWIKFSIVFQWSNSLGAWSSLRFSDTQHVEWSSLVLDASCLRGFSCRPKTATSDNRCPWLYAWPAQLDSLWVCARQSWTWRSSLTICLWTCHCHLVLGQVRCHNYNAALKTLRFCASTTLKASFSIQQTSAYTIRGAKAIILP
jgi:hypothetical protein